MVYKMPYRSYCGYVNSAVLLYHKNKTNPKKIIVMAKIAKSLTQLVGNTPLLELSNYSSKRDLQATLIGKLEYFNPAGSVKDRIALAMIEDAEKKGFLKKGSVIVEPTSGNTGV
jgi:cysteine synthase A